MVAVKMEGRREGLMRLFAVGYSKAGLPRLSYCMVSFVRVEAAVGEFWSEVVTLIRTPPFRRPQLEKAHDLLSCAAHYCPLSQVLVVLGYQLKTLPQHMVLFFSAGGTTAGGPGYEHRIFFVRPKGIAELSKSRIQFEERIKARRCIGEQIVVLWLSAA
jgi:hypothetical protein